MKDLFLMHPSNEVGERAVQSGEIGKYVIIYRKEREVASILHANT